MQVYRFSFTAASLMVSELVVLAKLLISVDFDYDQISQNEIKRDREATRKREFSELVLRLKTLSNEEIKILAESSLENQKLISFLACVRLYRIIREFVEEVILEKILLFDNLLSNRDISAFMYNKSLEYKEIEKLTEGTQKKVQQVIFKILEQAGIIDSVRTKKIQIPFLDFNLQNILLGQDKKYLLNL